MRLVFLFVLCSYGLCCTGSAQCLVPIGNDQFNITINGTKIRQTFTGQCNGTFTTATIQSNSVDTFINDVTLRILEGTDVTGRTVIYIKPNLQIKGRAKSTTITLDGIVAPVSALGQYTLEISHDSKNLELHAQSGGAAYAGGDVVDDMYDPVLPLADLVFQITADIDLPVSWLGFRAFAQNEQIILEWQTSSENNNEGFIIEHSLDGQQWQDIGFVAGAGNSERLQQYRFVDDAATPGLHYYRLRQVDYSETQERSDVVTVMVQGKEDFAIYPNPAQTTLSLQTEGSLEGQPISIYRLDGRLVQHLPTDPATLAEGRMTIAVDGLQPGMYVLRVGTLGSQKFVKR